MIRKIPYYLLILAIVPVLYLYQQNQRELFFSQTISLMVLSLIVSVLLMFLINIWIKNISKSAIIVTIFIFLFYSFGRIYKILLSHRISPKFITSDLLAVLFIIILLICASLILSHVKKTSAIEGFLTVFAVSFFILILWKIGYYEVKIRPKNIQAEERKNLQASKNKGEKPDIYYLILDGYDSNKILKNIYNFDNQDFTNYLKDKGFYLAENSKSNYDMTHLSLASSLNMDYVNDKFDESAKNSDDRKIPYGLIKNNEVIKKVKSEGYKYVHIGTGWGGADRNSNADENHSSPIMNEFQVALLKSTMLSIFENYIGGYIHKEKIMGAFDALREVPKQNESTFTFAHINCPHPPFVFAKDGRLARKIKFELDGDVWLDRQSYINQLLYTNMEVQKTLDVIFASSKIPPIIIVQADHGSASTFYNSEKNPWSDPDQTNLDERFGILNAYYLPEAEKSDEGLYDSISPVNSFRVVFDKYFSGSYGLLEDKNYFSNYNKPYSFREVSDKLK